MIYMYVAFIYTLETLFNVCTCHEKGILIQTDSDTPRANIFNTCELLFRIIVFVADLMMHAKYVADDNSVV